MNNKDIQQMTLEELITECDKIANGNDYARKIELCTQIIVKDPRNAVVFYNRGITYANLDKYQKAIEDYNQAIKLDPKLDRAFNNRGVAYKELGEYNRAIEDYNQAIKLNTKNASAFNNRGATYGKLGEYQKAIEDYDKAINLDLKYAAAYYNRGVAYRKLGQEEKAIEDFKKAQEIDPTIINKDLQEKTKKIEEFQEILEDLKTEHEKEEKNWFKWSKLAVGITLAIIVLVLILLAFCVLKSNDTYIIYIFSSIITFTIIRQYTNAKALRIEASNRLAMAKMFESVKTQDSKYQTEFLPKLADAIVYSTIKEKNNTDGLLGKLIDGLEKFKK